MKYGLALGGGGARGAFEAGVWRALMELKKEITHITGTSVGAINGAAFAAGVDAARLWREIRPEHIVSGAANEDMLSISALSRSFLDMVKGGLDTLPLRELLCGAIDEDRVRGSDISFGLCAFSVTNKRVEELFIKEIPRGRLMDYILASACFPIFKPVRIDGEDYTDGGIRNNLPENMLIGVGAKNIISVSVGGAGVVRDTDSCGVNIIKIRYKDREQGMMDFAPEHIERSISSGYFECMKAFCRYSGERFYVNNRSYSSAVTKYGRKLVSDIERAAELSGLEGCREYTFSELVRGTLERFSDCQELKKIVDRIEKEPPCFMHGKLDLLYKNFDAANAVAYFRRA